MFESNKNIRKLVFVAMGRVSCYTIKRPMQNGVIIMIENESAENYLETILMLGKKLPVVRSVDIANELGFKKSSVSVAMKNLREKRHITVTDAGFIYLTDSGRGIAEAVYERHEFISEWLIKLGVPKDIAASDACKIEHVLSRESYGAIKDFVRGRE